LNSNQASQSLAEQINDGDRLALAPDYSGCAMQVIAQLITAGRRQLKLVGVPQLGLQGDLLIGGNCVAEIDAAAVTLGEFGQAPYFTNAVTAQSLLMRDSTCPVIHAGLQASEKGIPFMPLGGILGSDLVKFRSDWKTINNPFADDESEPLLLVPAITPDVSLFHAPKADEHGNVWIGIRRELMTMAHASRKSLVSVEEIVPGNFLDNPETAAGTIPSIYISKIAVIPSGADPVGLFGCYEANASKITQYVKSVKQKISFDDVLRQLIDA